MATGAVPYPHCRQSVAQAPALSRHEDYDEREYRCVDWRGYVCAPRVATLVRKATMGLRERLGKLFGKSGATSATLTADRARAHEMHGRATGQTSGEQAGTR